MENRVLFNTDKSRHQFFRLFQESCNFKHINEIVKYMQISRSVFYKYLNGDLTIPKNLYDLMSLKLDIQIRNLFLRQICFLEGNWGRIKGGDSTFKNHKEIFLRGRERAHLLLDEKGKTFDIDMPLSEDLAYFIGLFIGDGFSNKYGRYYLTQLVGHKEHELSYYKQEISNLVSTLFGLTPKFKVSNDYNFFRFNIYSKHLYLFLTTRFGIKAGNKSRIVRIPQEILSSTDGIVSSCIAGIFDAEGCVFFDKRQNYTNPYPRLDLHMENPIILGEISRILNHNDILHSTSKNKNHILIYGRNNIQEFLSKFKLRNPKHIVKLKNL